jgi:hypothetical protein
MWMPDLQAWARDATRLLRPSGHLFVYEAHPAVPLHGSDKRTAEADTGSADVTTAADASDCAQQGPPALGSLAPWTIGC